MEGQRSLLDRVTTWHPKRKAEKKTEEEPTATPAGATTTSASAPPLLPRARTRLEIMKQEWCKELLQKALRQQELLDELEERKAIKDQRLLEKREIQDEIRGLQVRLEAADQAFHQAKADVTETVRKLNKL
ncbi:uncharacterized protein P174DRAFT_433783 [Aspergillus novofumigatus IBT 16806]|uniref:Uncharacterized protein n=1 Tax=Aspergillus novofumigatus (strain IBT 16806) TaxID=1392255 RepID=A0A2I1BZ69_ASPN1|nr:uncharacterized protein P174DRAFT_433783 [Aspergillus novofumigatus IBT 16806]PKX90665.1 hypothetical protein P174DRAFT_433783 [Aspergillus novofumigatus IBT 16806]